MITKKVEALGGEVWKSKRGDTAEVLDVKDEEPRWEEERKTAEDEGKKKTKTKRKGLKFRRD